VVKYVYKNFSKGHNRAQVSIEKEGQANFYDEIQSFVGQDMSLLLRLVGDFKVMTQLDPVIQLFA
jgi:hypothetical protein